MEKAPFVYPYDIDYLNDVVGNVGLGYGHGDNRPEYDEPINFMHRYVDACSRLVDPNIDELFRDIYQDSMYVEDCDEGDVTLNLVRWKCAVWLEFPLRLTRQKVISVSIVQEPVWFYGDRVRAIPQINFGEIQAEVSEMWKKIKDALSGIATLVAIGSEMVRRIADPSALAAGLMRFGAFVLDVVHCFYLENSTAMALHLGSMALRYAAGVASVFPILAQLFEVSAKHVVSRSADEGYDDYIPDYLGRSSVRAKAQGGKVIDENVVMSVFGFIKGIVFGDDSNSIRARADVITKTMQVALTGKNFVKLIIECFEYLVANFGEPPISSILREEIIQWQTEVLVTLTYPVTDMTSERAEVAVQLYARLGKISNAMMVAGVKLEVVHFISTAVQRCQAYNSSAMSYRRVAPVRAEPYGAVVVGAPGTGKSQAMPAIAKCAYACAFGTTIGDDQIHTRNSKDPWWDGLGSNCVCVKYDEFGAVSDPQIKVQESLEVMGLISSAPFMAPAAELTLKASSCFEGPMVFANSNNANNIDSALVTPAAFWRRMELIAVTVDPDNYDHIAHRCYKYEEDYSHLYFTVSKRVKKSVGTYDDHIVEFEGKPMANVKFPMLCAYIAGQMLLRKRAADMSIRSKFANETGLALFRAKAQMFESMKFWKKKEMKSKEEEMLERFKAAGFIVDQGSSSSPPVRDDVVTLDEKDFIPVDYVILQEQKSLFDRICSKWDNSQWRDWLVSHWKPIAGITVGVISVAVAAFFAWGERHTEAEAQAYSTDVRKEAPRRFQGRMVQSARPQMFRTDDDLIGHEIPPEKLLVAIPQVAHLAEMQKLAKVRANIAHMEVYCSANAEYARFGVAGVFTHGACFLTVAHMMAAVQLAIKDNDLLPERVRVRVTKNKVAWECMWSELVIYEFQDESCLADVAKVYFPNKGIGPFSDIRHFFPERVLDSELSGLYYVTPDENFGDHTYLIEARECSIFPRDTKIETEVSGRILLTATSVLSKGIDGSGYCGIVQVSLNPRVPWFILGIHYSALEKGRNAKSLTAVVTQSMLMDDYVRAEKQMSVGYEDMMEDCIFVASEQGRVYPKGALALGHVKKEYAVAKPRGSKIVQSQIYDKAESTRAPASLTPFVKDGERIVPFNYGLEKWGATVSEPQPNDMVFVRMGQQVVKNRVMKIEPALCRALYFKESLNTVACLVKRSVNINASLGSFWKREFKGKGKSGALVFEQVMKQFDASEKFKARFADVLFRLFKGEISYLAAEATLKDELRELAKVESGATRMFMAGNFVLNTIGVIFSGTFLEVFRNPVSGFCVGLDMTSTEIISIYRGIIMAFGPTGTIFGADVKQNDTQFPGLGHTGFADLEKDYYAKYNDPKSPFYVATDCTHDPDIGYPVGGEEGYKFQLVILEMLEKLGLAGYAIFGNVLVMMWKKLFSGREHTIECNTYLNGVQTYAAAFKAFYDRSIVVNPQNCDQFFRFGGIGDDVIGSADPKFSFFTQDELAKQVLQIFGRTMTGSGNKVGTIGELHIHPEHGRDLDAVVLMKRFFRVENGQLFMPLQEDVIREIPNWVNVDARPLDVRTREVAEAAIREWFFWGPEIFEREKAKINLRLERERLEPIPVSYTQLLMDWVERL